MDKFKGMKYRLKGKNVLSGDCFWLMERILSKIAKGMTLIGSLEALSTDYQA